jgi:hypothetical protein
MIIPKTPQSPDLVARHYDELDLFHRQIWGEHVHHGLWATDKETPAQAVESLIVHLAQRLALQPGQHVCDVGCGYGATGEWLAEHYDVYAWIVHTNPHSWEERHLLETIGREGHVVSMGTEADYHVWAGNASLVVNSSEDFTRQVRRT